MKQQKGIFVLIVLFLFLVFAARVDLFALTSVSRVAPSSVNPDSTFTVKYTANGGSGSWGVSIVDSVSGGCTPTEVKLVLTSPSSYAPVTFTAPSSGSCIFKGDYKIGTEPIVNFTDKTVVISSGSVGDEGCVLGEQICISVTMYKECLSNNQWSESLSCQSLEVCEGIKCVFLGEDDALNETDDALNKTIDNGEGSSEKIIPSISDWFFTSIFKLGEFEVQVWMIILIAGLIFLSSLIITKY